MPLSPRRVVVRAHPNIALIKYWGKRAPALNLPAVGSLSVTLEGLHSQTEAHTLGAWRHADDDDIAFEQTRVPQNAVERVRAFVQRLRAHTPASDASRCAVRLRLRNDFPTAAGLASSASGFAALVTALNALWDLSLSPRQCSAWARIGSGSAARSVFGGFVRMHKGERDDGLDAVAEPLCPADAWDLRVVVAIVSQEAKAVGSTDGMQSTVTTSPYWPAWVHEQPDDLATAQRAIAQRDFAALAAISERSCLKMHALALAASPGLLYWRPATVAGIEAVRALQQKKVPAFFTIDAGPQLKVVCLASSEAEVATAMRAVPGVQQVVCCRLGPGAHVVQRSW